MKYWRLAVLILLPVLSIFLESTVFTSYWIKGMGPDLILIFVVFMSILDGKRSGAAYGFICGLVEDAYLGRYIGMNALSKALVGYLIGNLRRQIYPEHLLTPLLAVVLGTLLNQAVNLLIVRLIGIPFVFTPDYYLAVLGQIAYHCILTIPLYIWYYNSYRQGALRP